MEKPYTDGQVMLKTHFSRHGGWYVVPFGCADPGECKGHIQPVYTLYQCQSVPFVHDLISVTGLKVLPEFSRNDLARYWLFVVTDHNALIQVKPALPAM